MPELYPWVLVAVVANCFLANFIIMAMAGSRYKAFTEEFMAQFEEEHKQAFPETELQVKGGLPDTGTGWYARKLPLKEWFELNTKTRVAANLVEWMPFYVVLPPIAGIFFPLPAIICCGVIFVARIGIACNFHRRGPFFMSQFFAVICLTICAIWSSVGIIQNGMERMKQEQALLEAL